jgi:Na+/proline symporter/nitrogen-specific signal transduction histidine kinase
MNTGFYLFCSFFYIGLLFFVAYWSDKQSKKGKSWVSNPYIYSLSLAVYCTAWTFYGSVGKASVSGMGYLPIYLGPAIFAPLWLIVVRKMILISKAQRITSISDFVSSRYGKSTVLGSMVTVIALLGIIPYISLQMRAIAGSLEILTNGDALISAHAVGNKSLPVTSTFYIAIVLSIFTILFGARNNDPNERHEGMVTAVAFESIVKLVSFLAVGIFVCYFMYNGFGDLFKQASENPLTTKMLFTTGKPEVNDWFWLSIVSMFAVILLPRQFHIAVVENTNPNHVAKAMWLFPLYMLLINIFVLPIALAGMMHFGGTGFKSDDYVLGLTLFSGHKVLALFVFLGGLSAATSMVIVETTALSIMISNHLVMPTLLRSMMTNTEKEADYSGLLLNVRRVIIFFILFLSFGYVKIIGSNTSLVSIGLISFAAVTQFAPAVFGGMFWKGATRAGAIAGLSVGFLTWALTLPIPSMSESNFLPHWIVDQGYFHQAFLKPYHLFGMEGFDRVSHSACWSLLFNTVAFVLVSLNTKQSAIEITQADYFVNIYKYTSVSSAYGILRREAKLNDLLVLMQRFLGEERTQTLMKQYDTENNGTSFQTGKANADLINYAETLLAGALGSSSAKILIDSVVKEDPISMEEMLSILDQTQDIIDANKVLKQKSFELEQTTHQLQTANKQLQELDRLKADFVTTVTHELRTPMTSIRALSKILMDNKDLSKEKHDQFLSIVVGETERITRLVNQVLDIEKIQSNAHNWQLQDLNLSDLLLRTYHGLAPTMDEQNIKHHCNILDQGLIIKADSDRITQVIVNLLSNAIKFCKVDDGEIVLTLSMHQGQAILKIADNGQGIPANKQAIIFQKFTQINSIDLGKPTGSGLGLFITKSIVEYHKGRIYIQSKPNKGAIFIVELPLK